MPKKKKFSEKIGFIGAGNMAKALIQGLIINRAIVPGRIYVSAKTSKNLSKLKKKHKIKNTQNNLEIVDQCKMIILAVKPQTIPDVCHQISKHLNKNHLIVSIAAGITTQRLRELLKGHSRIIRAMPNTPCLIGYGATGIYCAKGTKPKDLTLTQILFNSVGISTIVKEEHLMNILTGLSGSGPAYVFMFLEAMINAGIKAGLNPKIALKLCSQTILGAIKLSLESPLSPQILRQNVTSPGGTTEAGLKVLEEEKFVQTLENAIAFATQRSVELSKID